MDYSIICEMAKSMTKLGKIYIVSRLAYFQNVFLIMLISLEFAVHLHLIKHEKINMNTCEIALVCHISCNPYFT